MIILDEADHPVKLDNPVAGPTLRFPDRAAGRSSSPLPDYETSQAQHGLGQNKSLYDRADRRFWKATLYALCIYILLSIAIGVPLLVTRLKKSQQHGHPPPRWNEDDTLGAQSNAVFLLEPACNPWDQMDDILSQSLYTASVSHTLAPQGSLSIRSNVSREANEVTGISGNISISLNPDDSVSTVIITVTISSSTPGLRDGTRTCFADDGTERGLTLYIPSAAENESLHINIALLFPESSSILNFNSLTTSLPMFSLFFDNLGPGISFDAVSLEGSSQDIACEFLQSPKITIKNALAGISGKFNASDRFTLDTVGGPINADINLVQGDNRKGPTFFSLDTGNSEINANLTLQVTSRFSDPKHFFGEVRNFNGPLTVAVAHESNTPPAPLNLRVQNNQAESNVTLDSKYIGTFDVQTKLASVYVTEPHDDPSLDPFGEGEIRNYEPDLSTSSRIRGWVGWGKRKSNRDRKESGHVDIVSSLSPILLRLG